MKRILALFAFILLLVPLVSAYGVTFYNPAWNPQDGRIFDELIGGSDYTFNIKTQDIAITSIIIRVKEDTSNGGITIYHLKTVPDHLPAIDNPYEVNELKYTGFVPRDTLDFTYTFKVNKTWMRNASVSENGVALYAYDSVLDFWTEIPTTFIESTDDFSYYYADYPGVHYLYIGKAGVVSESETGVEEDDSTTTNEDTQETPAQEPSTTPVTQERQDEIAAPVEKVDLEKKTPPVVIESKEPEPVPEPDIKKTPEEEEKESRLNGVVILIVLAVFVAVIYIIMSKKKETYSVDRELNNYIKESLKRGKSKQDIRSRLLEVGWHHDRVKNALAKHDIHDSEGKKGFKDKIKDTTKKLHKKNK